MKSSLLGSLGPGKEYRILQQGYHNVQFSLGEHRFSQESLAKAKELWVKAPGKFDGTLMGVTKITEQKGTVHIEVVPMQYSLFRYIAKCRKENIPLEKRDEIFPIGIASVSYYTDKAGKRYFLMGIKGAGHIEEGKLEFVPQGFCNPPESKDMKTYVIDSINRELQEELTVEGQKKPRIKFKKVENLALIIEDSASDYALQVECEIATNGKFPYDGITTEEHERILMVSESELEQVLEDPTTFVQRKTPDLKKKSIEIQNSTRALAFSYLAKHKSRFS